MRGLVLCLVLFALAAVVVGISLAVLRYLHWSVLSYVLIVPIWIAVFVVLVMVARVTFKRSHNQIPNAR
jgi:hypothetical protein